jgi:phosphotransferase system enzyme I (PtsI)
MLNETLTTDSDNTKELQGFLKGIPSSNGIAIASAEVYEQDHSYHYDFKISEDEIESEMERLKVALEHLNFDYQEVLKNSSKLSSVVSQIIETYQLILNDEFVLNNVYERIKKRLNAESAVVKEFDTQKELFAKSKDEIIRERGVDIENVKLRIISALNQRSPDYNSANGKIIVAQNLTPTDIVKLKEAGALGIITEIGGIASHVSILARSFEMPAIIGVKDATKMIHQNQELIIDGFTGLIIYSPDFSILLRYKKKINEIEEHKKKLGDLVKVATKTIDNKIIHLFANIDRLDDIKSALITGSEGIGLARSETLLSGLSRIPDEEMQFGWYREIANRMFPNEVTIRCFDIGSDKFSAGIPIKESNPALGLRGIRYLLYNKYVFKQQLRAILRASINRNVRIMLPMISDIGELMSAKAIVNECMQELEANSISYDANIKVGIMIETPAAVMTAETLAPECDFFSIGSNDLTQYTLAADRTNELVTEIYDSFHPAVLKMIAITSKVGRLAGIPVCVCGELASHSAATQLLLGMGITELSLPGPLLLELKNRILKINYSDSVKLADELLKLPNSFEILKRLEN